MKSIFTYIDYRAYLRDFYLEKKKTSRFSYREFSRCAGFSSPVFIKLLIEGKANLRKSSITKVCKAIGLKKEERRYFRDLVLFGQAKNIDEKMRFLNQLKSSQGSLTIKSLTNEQFEYFSKWYHPIIKELLDIAVFDGDYKALGEMVNPPISEREAKRSVRLLIKLGLVQEKDGEYSASHKFVTTEGLTMGTLAVRSVQKKMANLGGESVDTVPKDKRDVSGVSVSINSGSIDKIREELARCRRRIMEIAKADEKCDSVCRVNLHMFPVSKTLPDSLIKRNEGEK